MDLQPLRAFDDNYIWLLHDQTGGAIVVDPGEAEPVLAAAEDGLRPTAILLTHHHADHVGGVPSLLEHWPELPVVAPPDPRITCANRIAHDGEAIEVGGRTFKALSVPGHTSSHVAFHLEEEGEAVVFSGDTLFSLGCGRMFEGSPAQMLASLSRLAGLPGHTRLCCGHEYTMSNAAFAAAVEPHNPDLRQRTREAQAMIDAHRPTLPSSIASELACNPFLRCGQPEIVATVAHRLGREPVDAVEVFAELRRWKDGFSA